VAELQRIPRSVIPGVNPVNELFEGIRIMAAVGYGMKIILLPQ
jgi:hypothetical protein